MNYETVEDIQSDFCNFIIGLAESFDGKRLAALQQENKWLDEFEPRSSQANIKFELSEVAFRNDGHAFLKTLEEFAELYYRELVTISLSRNYASFFVPLIAEISAIISRATLLMESGARFDKEASIKEYHKAFNTWKTLRKTSSLQQDFTQELGCWERSLELVNSRPVWHEDR